LEFIEEDVSIGLGVVCTQIKRGRVVLGFPIGIIGGVDRDKFDELFERFVKDKLSIDNGEFDE
jgi:hypothetical protein